MVVNPKGGSKATQNLKGLEDTMVQLTIRKLIADKRGAFSHLGESRVRSFASEELAAAWLDWQDRNGVANWEKYEVYVNTEVDTFN